MVETQRFGAADDARAAMETLQQPRIREKDDVAADGLRRNAELFRQALYGHEARRLRANENLILPAVQLRTYAVLLHVLVLWLALM